MQSAASVSGGMRYRTEYKLRKITFIGLCRRRGELSAVLQYTYGHLVTEGAEPSQLSAVLSCVSVTEMRHLEILGELITKLGGDPKFCDMQRRGCFDAGKVNYQTSPDRILRAAISGKRRR